MGVLTIEQVFVIVLHSANRQCRTCKTKPNKSFAPVEILVLINSTEF